MFIGEIKLKGEVLNRFFMAPPASMTVSFIMLFGSVEKAQPKRLQIWGVIAQKAH